METNRMSSATKATVTATNQALEFVDSPHNVEQATQLRIFIMKFLTNSNSKPKFPSKSYSEVTMGQ